MNQTRLFPDFHFHLRGFYCDLFWVSTAGSRLLPDATTASHLEPPWHTPPPPPPPPGGKLVWGRRHPCMGGSLSERACRSAHRLSHMQTGWPPLEHHRNTMFTVDPRLLENCPDLFSLSDSEEHKNPNHQLLLLHCQKIQTSLWSSAQNVPPHIFVSSNPWQSLLRDFVFPLGDLRNMDGGWIPAEAAGIQEKQRVNEQYGSRTHWWSPRCPRWWWQSGCSHGH